MTLERVAPFVLLVLVFTLAVRPTVDNDLWWQLATGRWVVDHHAVIGPDPFTYTHAGDVRLAVDWLGHALFYATWSVGGLTAVSLLVALLAVVGLGFVYAACVGSVLTRVGVVALAAMASSIFWSDRAQMFSYALSGIAVWLLVTWRRDTASRRIWWFVPMCAVWANLHGASVYGALLVWGTAAGIVIDGWRSRRTQTREVRTIVLVAAASTVALLLNPTGVGVLVGPWRQLRANVPAIDEFQPPSLTDPAAWPFFAMLAVTGTAMVVAARRAARTGTGSPVETADWILVVATAGLALRVTRAVALFAVVAAPVLAACVAATVATGADRPEGRARTVLLTSMAMLALLAGTVSVRNRLDAADRDIAASYPTDATAWLQARVPAGRVWSAYTWGGYLEWAAPGVATAVDSRNDLFGAGDLERYRSIATGDPAAEWSATFDRDGVDAVVVPPTFALAAQLRADPRWRVGFEDAGAVVFVRA